MRGRKKSRDTRSFTGKLEMLGGVVCLWVRGGGGERRGCVCVVSYSAEHITYLTLEC